MAKKIALIVLAFAFAAVVIFTGCTPARRPYAPGQYDNTGMNTNYGNTDRGYQGTDQDGSYDNYTKVGDELGIRDWTNDYRTGLNDGLTPGTTGLTGTNTGNNTGNANTGTRQADDIARAGEQVEGVENATVVLAGNTAYVGIDLDDNIRNSNLSDIKRKVAQVVREKGNNINTVYVSTEADFMDRLRNVGNGLRNGTGANTFTNELNEMVQRITPTRW